MIDKQTLLEWHAQAAADRAEVAAIAARTSTFAPAAETLEAMLTEHLRILDGALEHLDFSIPDPTPSR